MSRISDKFIQLKAAGKKALIPYISAGDPNPEITYQLVLEMERRGADIIELGVPFSDPIADGPVIQKASMRALQGGINLPKILGLTGKIRLASQIPLIFMTYYNPILHYGEELFVQAAKKSGVDGLIVPDLPPEEAESLIKLCQKNQLDLIFLLAPTSTPERIAKVCQYSQGFIYYVSLTGITGTGLANTARIENKLNQIKQVTDKPIAVGFGVSTPEQATQIASWSNGVIVGSAIIRVMEQNLADEPKLIADVGNFVAQLKQAIR
ncbi:MAG: tryptophan synthase subunit alpha [Candidatus Schekmanbacteria bacterium]|nr:tryptophan synthase subunit alpha [Candidatus Schekmanbacteria bacterium]